jgi:hypothetical protein
MPPQISALRERFLAEKALKGPHAGMFAEVVPQVAGFLEDAPAVGIFALEVELDALRLRIPHPDGLVPLLRHPLKSLVLVSS